MTIPSLPRRAALRARRAAPALLASAILGCGAAGGPLPGAMPISSGEPLQGRSSSHVVLVSVDGLRPDAIEAFGAKTLGRLVREGSYTLAATTILPSKTLPSHTSMLTGEDVHEHGITWNSNRVSTLGHVRVPTVFDVARAHGFHTAAFFSKTKFEHLQRKGAFDYSQAPPHGWLSFLGSRWSASRTTGDAERYLLRNRPNLLFVHLGEPDYAGHLHGWMSKQYGKAVGMADAAIGRLIVAGDRAFGAGNWTLLVTADHGGHGTDHGSSDPRDVTIPWIAWGKGVRAGGQEIADPVRTFDTASTVLWLLGLDEPADWAGTPVAAALIDGGVPASHATGTASR